MLLRSGKNKHDPKDPAERKGRILVADDSDTLRLLYIKLLQMDGWTTLEARDGKEALAKAVSENVDVILLDNRMPELLGAEVYEKLRSLGIHTPVVLVTAANEVKELASMLGIRHYIGKPFGPSDLRRTVLNAFQENVSDVAKSTD